MNYIILCDTFTQAVIGARVFAKHYSENSNMKVVKRQVEVIVGDNKFIFINNDDPRSTKGRRGNVIPFETFRKKYFTPNSQTP